MSPSVFTSFRQGAPCALTMSFGTSQLTTNVRTAGSPYTVFGTTGIPFQALATLRESRHQAVLMVADAAITLGGTDAAAATWYTASHLKVVSTDAATVDTSAMPIGLYLVAPSVVSDKTLHFVATDAQYGTISATTRLCLCDVATTATNTGGTGTLTTFVYRGNNTARQPVSFGAPLGSVNPVIRVGRPERDGTVTWLDAVTTAADIQFMVA